MSNLFSVRKNPRWGLDVLVLGCRIFHRQWTDDGSQLELYIFPFRFHIPRKCLKGTFVQWLYEKYLGVVHACCSFRPYTLRNAVECYEKKCIEESGMWDALWYVRTYNHKFNRPDALDYWYKKGWRKGENPSPSFDVGGYLASGDKRNPILRYLDWNCSIGFASCNNLKSDDDKNVAARYQEHKPARKAKGVVYTCITGDYDDLTEILAFTHTDFDWDYVCFTDSVEDVEAGMIGIWEIRPLAFSQLDATRNNRWHKMHPHILFPEYDVSIYIDANTNITSPYIFNLASGMKEHIRIPVHPFHLCVYQEYEFVERFRLDDVKLVDAEKHFLEEQGMPKNYGSTENNIILRHHNDESVISMMDDWWHTVEKFSRRDQLSMPWVLWKNGVAVEDIIFPNIRALRSDFYQFCHKKRIRKGQ